MKDGSPQAWQQMHCKFATTSICYMNCPSTGRTVKKLVTSLVITAQWGRLRVLGEQLDRHISCHPPGSCSLLAESLAKTSNAVTLLVTPLYDSGKLTSG